MTLVVDANIAVAVLDPADPFHRSALRNCLKAEQVKILNLTRAEALIHPTRAGRLDAADAALNRLGFQTVVIENNIVDLARDLRAAYGNRNFALVDAVVVALGIQHDWPILTCDAKWPTIERATIEVLKAD